MNTHMHATTAHPHYCQAHDREFYPHTCQHGTGCQECDLERAVEAARAGLPEAANGRLERAVELVRAGQVYVSGARAAVKSQSTERIYVIDAAGCRCEDAHYQAPKVAGLPACKHMIAVWLRKKMSQQVSVALAGSACSQPPATNTDKFTHKHGAVKPGSMNGDNYTAWCKHCEADTAWGFGIGCLTCMRQHLEVV